MAGFVLLIVGAAVGSLGRVGDDFGAPKKLEMVRCFTAGEAAGFLGVFVGPMVRLIPWGCFLSIGELGLDKGPKT